MEKKFIFLDHTADIKFKIHGKDLNEIFENTVLALSKYISGDKKLKDKEERSIIIEGKDQESILYKFIDEIIYLLDAEGFVVKSAKVKIKDDKLTAELSGDNTSGYNLNHIKAATYSEMYVKKTKTCWEAQAVVDV